MKTLSLLLLATAATFTAPTAYAQQCICPEREQTINCGHRGTGNSGPDNPFIENTIEGLLQAELEGATMVEIDVQPTADGGLVLFHDDELDDLTDGTGCVTALTTAELQALTIDGGGTIPTLPEALAAVSVDVNIELKDGTGTCPNPPASDFAHIVFTAIEADDKDREIIVTSFGAGILEQLRLISVELYLGRIAFSSSIADEAAAAGMHAVVSRWDQLSIEDLEATHELNMDQAVYTVNSSLDLRTAVDLGVDMIITDEPDALEAIFADLCADFVPDPECDEGDDDDDDGAGDDDDDDDDGTGCSCSSSLSRADTGGATLALMMVVGLSRRRRPAR